MKKTSIIFLTIFLFGFSKSFFSSDSSVITLNTKTFNEKVLQSNDIWLLLFYNPENEDCKILKPEYEKAALAMKDMFKLGAIDIKSEKDLSSRYNVTLSPTFKFFGTDKNENPKDFNSKKKAASIIEKMFLKVQSFANNKLNITDDEANLYNIEHNPNIVVLNDNNFDDEIQKNELMWLIAIYSPTCGICKNLLPQWVKAAERLRDKAVFAIIDGKINRKTATRFLLKGYPLIKIYSPGFGRMKKVEDYDGPREENGIVEYVLQKLEKYMYVKEPPQILNQDILKQECINKEGYCIITLFPSIIKSNAKERNNYIGNINKLAQNYKLRPIHFVWAQEGDFHRLEKNLKITRYPVTFAVNFRKRLFSYKKFNDNFGDVSLNEFVQNVLNEKENMMEYIGGFEIVEALKWDRKDYINEDL